MGRVRANDRMKRHIAREYARGTNAAAIARQVGYQPCGIRKLLTTPQMQELVALEEAALEETAEKTRVELFRLGGKAVDVLREILENPQHPRRLSTARFVLDKMLPEERGAQVTQAGMIQDEESRRVLRDAFMGIAQGIAVMQESGRMGRGIERVRQGPEALLRPVVDVDAEGSGV